MFTHRNLFNKVGLNLYSTSMHAFSKCEQCPSCPLAVSLLARPAASCGLQAHLLSSYAILPELYLFARGRHLSTTSCARLFNIEALSGNFQSLEHRWIVGFWNADISTMWNSAANRLTVAYEGASSHRHCPFEHVSPVAECSPMSTSTEKGWCPCPNTDSFLR
jgi:hypothetical protein